VSACQIEWHEIAGVYSTQRGAGCDWNHSGDLERRFGKAGLQLCRQPPPIRALQPRSQLSCQREVRHEFVGSSLRSHRPSRAWRLGTAIFLSRPQTEISAGTLKKLSL
jgi:hypothetical protein